MVLCKEAGPELITALRGFINFVLAGHCPTGVAPVFFGGRLLALSKKSGGLRPIDIGFSPRRLASKCANQFGSNRLKSSFHPNQVGVGIHGGFEAAIHSARRFLEGMPADNLMVKLDFANAFNRLHRRDILPLSV